MNYFVLCTVIIVYLAALAWLGYLGYKHTKNSTDYLVGGRNVHPYVMAMSYGATFISTSAIVGFGGLASLYGLSLLWLTAMNILVGVFVAFIFFGKRTRRMGLLLNAHTFPELLGRRFESTFIQRFTGLVIFILMPLYTAAVLIGGAKILEYLLGIDYRLAVTIFAILVAAYVIFGGLKGVMYTDALQGTLMLAGMVFFLIFVYFKLGGFTNAHSNLDGIKSLVTDGMKAAGTTGWASSPRLFSENWWVIYSSIVMGVGVGVLAQPQLAVRFMTVKSDRELNRAVGIGGVFILAIVGTAYLAGSLTNLFFLKDFNMLSIVYAKGNPDNVIPLFIAKYLPSWFGYVFLLVILSAAMSTLSSQFHTIGTSIGRDLFTLGRKTGSGKLLEKETLITRIGMAFSILLTVFLSLTISGGFIARATSIFFGVMANAFLAPFLLGLYWKRMTKSAAIASMIGGMICSLLGYVLFHTKESMLFGLSKFLTGNNALIPGIFGSVDPLIYSLPISFLLAIVVSFCTKNRDPQAVSDLIDKVKHQKIAKA